MCGPYTVKAQDGTVIDFMCMTMIDPATAWFEMEQIPTVELVTKDTNGNPVTKESFEKTSARISRIVNKLWFSRYPRPESIVFDNGSEFKLHFQSLCKDYGIKRKPTTIKNPTANAVLERMHGVMGNMMRTRQLDGQEMLTEDNIDDFIINAAWAVCSMYHTVLGSSPGAAIFGRDMLFDIPYLVDWTKIGDRRQAQVDRDVLRKNRE